MGHLQQGARHARRDEHGRSDRAERHRPGNRQPQWQARPGLRARWPRQGRRRAQTTQARRPRRHQVREPHQQRQQAADRDRRAPAARRGRQERRADGSAAPAHRRRFLPGRQEDVHADRRRTAGRVPARPEPQGPRRRHDRARRVQRPQPRRRRVVDHARARTWHHRAQDGQHALGRRRTPDPQRPRPLRATWLRQARRVRRADRRQARLPRHDPPYDRARLRRDVRTVHQQRAHHARNGWLGDRRHLSRGTAHGTGELHGVPRPHQQHHQAHGAGQARANRSRNHPDQHDRERAETVADQRFRREGPQRADRTRGPGPRLRPRGHRHLPRPADHREENRRHHDQGAGTGRGDPAGGHRRRGRTADRRLRNRRSTVDFWFGARPAQ